MDVLIREQDQVLIDQLDRAVGELERRAPAVRQKISAMRGEVAMMIAALRENEATSPR